jgi:hypothetical protein
MIPVSLLGPSLDAIDHVWSCRFGKARMPPHWPLTTSSNHLSAAIPIAAIATQYSWVDPSITTQSTS